MEKFYLSDNVVARIVQILQEGLLMGIDVTDHFRMIELVADSDEETGKMKLELDPDYAKRIIQYHIDLEKQAIALHEEEQMASQSKIIV
jgi:hypothetical protein